MPGRRLSILTVISLAMEFVLVCGYFVDVGPMVQRVRIAGSTLSIGGFYIRLRYGCCDVVSFHWTATPANYPAVRPGLHFYFPFRAARPTMQESLWGFQIINVGVSRGLRFPIWCLIPQCAIAPMLWLRRRRRSLGRGFAVEPAPV
jgi:hypothetical protein